jgi:hypothetical protein
LKAGFGGSGDAADMGGGRRFSTRDPNDIFKQFFQACVSPLLALHFGSVELFSRLRVQLATTMMTLRVFARSAQVVLADFSNSIKAPAAACLVDFSPVLEVLEVLEEFRV